MQSIAFQNNIFEDQFISSKPPSLRGTNREEILNYFKNAWHLYNILFDSIIDDATYYQSPDPLRNPIIFYYGHTAAFYVNKLFLSKSIDQGLNPDFEILFAKGVDPENPQDLDFTDIWPAVDEVRNYRVEVYDLVIDVIEQIDIPDQITCDHPLWALHMGIEHDRIHFETSSVLIRQLNVEWVDKPAHWNYAPTSGGNVNNEWIQFDSGIAQLGKQEPSELYGWDNEFGSIQCFVKPFQVTKNMVTNGDYLAFVRSNAYNNPIYWSEEGLKWKNRSFAMHPKFWIPNKNNGFAYRAMFDILEMPLDWPVEVNKFEAQAYITYLDNNYRLLTEKEFQLIVKNDFKDREPVFDKNINLSLQFGSPSPAGYFSKNDNHMNDLFGNVWDWLDDDFNHLPGFKTHPWYEDFSQPYFDDQHSMLLGGSWATTGTAASKYYRLWFRDYFYQHAGFRLAKSID